MSTHNITRHVGYTADQIYAIAADVGAYGKFLPAVREVTIRNYSKSPQGTETFDAALQVGIAKFGIRENFLSRVEANPVARSVVSTSEGGPMKHLRSVWKIAPSPQGGSDIDYSVDFELNSRTMQLLLSQTFDLVVNRVMTAFERRAHDLYGAPAA
jgi:coenzyme Q-binding protein COQ10